MRAVAGVLIALFLFCNNEVEVQAGIFKPRISKARGGVKSSVKDRIDKLLIVTSSVVLATAITGADFFVFHKIVALADEHFGYKVERAYPLYQTFSGVEQTYVLTNEQSRDDYAGRIIIYEQDGIKSVGIAWENLPEGILSVERQAGRREIVQERLVQGVMVVEDERRGKPVTFAVEHAERRWSKGELDEDARLLEVLGGNNDFHGNILETFDNGDLLVEVDLVSNDQGNITPYVPATFGNGVYAHLPRHFFVHESKVQEPAP